MTADPGRSGGETDADLVAGVRAGDRASFAAVYDRYGDRLYDFAHSMLRHREEAEDAVADSFVLVAERIGQLREADRLRPWLYAIVRSECLRRLRARKRTAFGGDEAMADMADSARGPEEEAELVALRVLVWDAAAGLADRDRALLDLHLRHGLEGAELAAAMDITPSQAYVLLSRLRDQVDRSLGALLVARLGRDDCDELARVLGDWDGTFSPLMRKRVARHVDGCDTCSARRKIVVSPWALLAGVPLLAAPVALRDRVVNDTQLVAMSTGPVGGGGAPSRRALGTAAGVAAVVTITVAALVLRPWADDTAPLAEDPGPTSAPATTEAPITPTSTPSVVVAAGTVTVSTTLVDLGGSASSGTIALANPGGQAVDVTITPSATWLTASPRSVSLDPGGRETITVRADRAQVAEGQGSGTLRVAWAGGTETVLVRLDQDRPPVVGAPTATFVACGQPVPVSVQVDDTDVSQVRLDWSGPSGPGSSMLSRGSGSTWSGSSGPFPIGGQVTYSATAVDAGGSTVTGPASSIEVFPCPG